MIRIGAFSQMNKVTVKTLRYYDEVGLLKPVKVDDWTNYRYYSASQMPRLHRILALREIGFSIPEIKEALNDDMTTEKMIEFLSGKSSETSRNLEKEQQKLNRIRGYINTLKKERKMSNYNVITKELPEVVVASMRTVIPNYDYYNKIYPEMGEVMRKQNVKCLAPEYCFTMYHDGEYKEKDIDVEICEAVVEAKEDTEKVKYKTIPAVTAAVTVHKGPYSTIGQAYSAVMNWIEENGYQVADCPRESYIDGIWNKENPEDWVTEIQIPIKK